METRGIWVCFLTVRQRKKPFSSVRCVIPAKLRDFKSGGLVGNATMPLATGSDGAAVE